MFWFWCVKIAMADGGSFYVQLCSFDVCRLNLKVGSERNITYFPLDVIGCLE